MRGVVNIIIGIVFIIGGLSGNLVLRGTGSGGLLAVVGVGLIILGIVRMTKGSGDAPAHARMKAGRKAVALNETVVYKERDSKSQPLIKLAPGNEIEIVEASEINDVQWVCVKLLDGRQGYVLGHHLAQK
ncbi:MAG TPA: hypothetical protein VGC91_20475 [Pyrinomonadaceae bacterium]|jgi:hypothetical protein